MGEKGTETCLMMSKEKVHKVLMQLGGYEIAVLAIKNILWWIWKCKLKMSCFEFGQLNTTSKDFKEQRQVSNIFMID